MSLENENKLSVSKQESMIDHYEHQGFLAKEAGDPITSNPILEDGPERRAWERGWNSTKPKSQA